MLFTSITTKNNFSNIALASVLTSVFIVLLAGCGGQDPVPQPDLRNTQQSTAMIIAEARAAGAPSGVDDQVYSMLLAELERVLELEATTKVVSAPPSGLGNQIVDLTYTDNDLESFSLSWSYTNAGDYDNNSEVNVADITPIGVYYGKNQSDPDWNAGPSDADGDGNGEVNISDITVIGQHFGKSLGGYNIYRAEDAESTPEMIGTIAFDAIADFTQPLVFTELFTLGTAGDFYKENAAIYSVVPFDAGGTEPAGSVDPAEVLGDEIVLYSSKYIDDYPALRWNQDPAGPDGIQPPIPDWIYARFTALTPEVDPPPIPDQQAHEFIGQALLQSIEARFNLSKGTGRITLASEDGLLSSSYRGVESAFAVHLTADVAAGAPFSEESMAATPFVVINTDSTLVSVEEFLAGGMDYAGEMADVQANVGVFFPVDPLNLNTELDPIDWEKWCILQSITGRIPDLQEY